MVRYERLPVAKGIVQVIQYDDDDVGNYGFYGVSMGKYSSTIFILDAATFTKYSRFWKLIVLWNLRQIANRLIPRHVKRNWILSILLCHAKIRFLFAELQGSRLESLYNSIVNFYSPSKISKVYVILDGVLHLPRFHPCNGNSAGPKKRNASKRDK